MNNVFDESTIVASSSKVANVQIHYNDNDELPNEVLADALKLFIASGLKSHRF